MALLATTALVIGMSAPQAQVSAAGNHFFPGYCTWDSAEQAHKAWGVWVPWYGDAGDWIDGALASGWRVSPEPQVDNIIVLPGGVQGSGAYGHVAWVLSVEPDGVTVTVRSMHWSALGEITVHTLRADGRAQFIMPPE